MNIEILKRELRSEYNKLVVMEDRHDLNCGIALQEHIVPELATQRQKVAELLAMCKEYDRLPVRLRG